MNRFVFVTLFAAAALFAQKDGDAVKAADKAWAEATVKGDKAALTALLAEDLTYVHSTGDIDTRQMFIDNLSNGVRKYTRIDHENMDVRVYGNTAVLQATARIETVQKGKAGPAHLRFIHVWVKQGEKWRMVAHQPPRLPN